MFLDDLECVMTERSGIDADDWAELRSGNLTLSDLINLRRGRRSYETLAEESGGNPKLSSWQQWGSGKPRVALPEVDSIKGMALALGVSQTDVLMAAARSVGLSVAPHDPSELRIAGAGLLPIYAQESVFNVARALMLLASEKR